MPAKTAPPTIEDYRQAFRGGVLSKREDADLFNSGSSYDVFGGWAAQGFYRLSTRARGNFRNIYFDSAEGVALSDRVALLYPDVAPAPVESAGLGYVLLARPTAGGGGDFIYEGTRFSVSTAGGISYYLTAETVYVDPTAVTVELPIYAEQTGTGQSIDAQYAVIESSVYDATFHVIRIVCADGTDGMKASAYRAQVRVEHIANRPGYIADIEEKLRAAGADQIEFFASDYFGEDEDHGLNRIFVSDVSYTTTAALLLACRLALFDCGMWGAATQVLPLQRQSVKLTATVKLWAIHATRSRDGLETDIRDRLVEYISSNPYTWDLNSASGHARQTSNDIETLAVTANVTPPNKTAPFDVVPLTRWFCNDSDVTVIFQ